LKPLDAAGEGSLLIWPLLCEHPPLECDVSYRDQGRQTTAFRGIREMRRLAA
jgi:hypothetical protein